MRSVNRRFGWSTYYTLLSMYFQTDRVRSTLPCDTMYTAEHISKVCPGLPRPWISTCIDTAECGSLSRMQHHRAAAGPWGARLHGEEIAGGHFQGHHDLLRCTLVDRAGRAIELQTPFEKQYTQIIVALGKHSKDIKPPLASSTELRNKSTVSCQFCPAPPHQASSLFNICHLLHHPAVDHITTKRTTCERPFASYLITRRSPKSWSNTALDLVPRQPLLQTQFFGFSAKALDYNIPSLFILLGPKAWPCLTHTYIHTYIPPAQKSHITYTHLTSSHILWYFKFTE